MRRHVVDYLQDRAESGSRTLLNRGFWLHDVPRLMPLCRLLGHRPIVDGTETRHGCPGSRWVCCDRCGLRPCPQGSLDPDTHQIGDVYNGPFSGSLPVKPKQRREAQYALKGRHYPPGPWPSRPASTLGGQLVLGPSSFGGVGIGVKVGNPGSEHVLSADLRLHPLGALYVHTEQHGKWLQRRLNPSGYDSRVIEIAVDDGRLRWRLWAKRDEWSSDTPRWQDGSVVVSPRELLFGPVRHNYTDVGDPVTVTVRMPHGDDHDVSVQLQRHTTGRTRSRKTQSWSADWRSETGIPFRHDSWKGDNVHASGVEVTDEAVEQGTWPVEAAAAIAAQVTRDRVRYNYRPHAAA